MPPPGNNRVKYAISNFAFGPQFLVDELPNLQFVHVLTIFHETSIATQNITHTRTSPIGMTQQDSNLDNRKLSMCQPSSNNGNHA